MRGTGVEHRGWGPDRDTRTLGVCVWGMIDSILNNGNSNEWSPIRSVIVECGRLICLITTSMITEPI